MIRKAEVKDIGKILDLLTQVDMVHHKGRPDLFKGPATKYSRAELEEMINGDSIILVYTDEQDLPVGYSFCILKQEINNNILTDIKTLYIDDICVDQEQRGKKIGKALYDASLKLAKELGCYNLTLNVWACNKEAITFYEKQGLTPQKIGMEKIING